jgi:transcriptional regulator with XRE-family HTH domain
MKNPEHIKNLGLIIKLLRKGRGYTQEFMAHRLNYKDKGIYAKLERGEIKSIDFFYLLELCIILDCNVNHVCSLAGIALTRPKLPLESLVDELTHLSKEQTAALLEAAEK